MDKSIYYMFEAPKNTKITLAHGHRVIHMEFDHWDTGGLELIEGFLGVLTAAGFSEGALEDVIVEMAAEISDRKKIDHEELHD